MRSSGSGRTTALRAAARRARPRACGRVLVGPPRPVVSGACTAPRPASPSTRTTPTSSTAAGRQPVRISTRHSDAQRGDLSRARRSRACASSTGSPVEHVVVDGGSTDGTLDLLRELRRVVVISEPDSGLYDAINKGVGLATGTSSASSTPTISSTPGALVADRRRLRRDTRAHRWCAGVAEVFRDDCRGYRNDRQGARSRRQDAARTGHHPWRSHPQRAVLPPIVPRSRRPVRHAVAAMRRRRSAHARAAPRPSSRGRRSSPSCTAHARTPDRSRSAAASRSSSPRRSWHSARSRGSRRQPMTRRCTPGTAGGTAGSRRIHDLALRAAERRFGDAARAAGAGREGRSDCCPSSCRCRSRSTSACGRSIDDREQRSRARRARPPPEPQATTSRALGRRDGTERRSAVWAARPPAARDCRPRSSTRSRSPTTRVARSAWRRGHRPGSVRARSRRRGHGVEARRRARRVRRGLSDRGPHVPRPAAAGDDTPWRPGTTPSPTGSRSTACSTPSPAARCARGARRPRPLRGARADASLQHTGPRGRASRASACRAVPRAHDDSSACAPMGRSSRSGASLRTRASMSLCDALDAYWSARRAPRASRSSGQGQRADRRCAGSRASWPTLGLDRRTTTSACRRAPPRCSATAAVCVMPYLSGTQSALPWLARLHGAHLIATDVGCIGCGRSPIGSSRGAPGLGRRARRRARSSRRRCGPTSAGCRSRPSTRSPTGCSSGTRRSALA